MTSPYHSSTSISNTSSIHMSTAWASSSHQFLFTPCITPRSRNIARRYSRIDYVPGSHGATNNSLYLSSVFSAVSLLYEDHKDAMATHNVESVLFGHMQSQNYATEQKAA